MKTDADKEIEDLVAILAGRETPEDVERRQKIGEVVRTAKEDAFKEEEIKRFRRNRDFNEVQRQQEFERRLGEARLDAEDPGFATKHAAATRRRVGAPSIHFITDDYTNALPKICSGDLVLVGAQTGHGKSTFSANLAASNMARGKRVLIITNEETENAVRNRVACIELGYDFTHLADGSLSADAVDEVNRRADEDRPRLKVVSDEELSGRTSTEEGMRRLLVEELPAVAFDLVIFDFITGCTPTGRNQSKTATLLAVMSHFKTLKNSYPAPFVVFAQLSPKSRAKPEFGDRIQWANHLLNDATLAVEIIKDDTRNMTLLRRHKARFDNPALPRRAVARFQQGRLLDLPDAEMKAIVDSLTEDAERKSA